MTLRQRFVSAVGVVLKYTLNPLTRRLAKTSFGPFALVRHVGRRSGKPYETPVIVAPIGGGVIVELTYGPDVDWYKNVMAAGKCTVVWHGQPHEVDHFEPLDFEAGRAAFPMPARLILHVTNRTHFIKFGFAAS